MSADGMVHADDGTEDASRVTASAYTRQDATLWRLSVSLVSKKQPNAIYSGGGYLDPICIWLSGTSTTVTLLSRRAVCEHYTAVSML